jgi:hypothetical protein
LQNSADKTHESTPANQSKTGYSGSKSVRNQTKKIQKPVSAKKRAVKNLSSNSKEEEKCLAQRKDVVYKTLIRSLKRYITDQCDLTLQKGWSKKDKERAFFAQVDKVYETLYSDKVDGYKTNRPVTEIIDDRDFIRNDESIKLDPENIKIYL